MRRRLLLGCVVALLLCASPAAAAQVSRPNIVFVLTDDLAWNLVPYMPQRPGAAARGHELRPLRGHELAVLPVARLDLHAAATRTAPACCTNMPPAGGFEVFHLVEEQSTFATSLQAAGYRTAMMGKYLNGYRPGAGRRRAGFVPPGWTAWAVAGDGYANFNYNLLVKQPGHAARDRPLRQPAARLPDRRDLAPRPGASSPGAVKAGKPFMLELATFAPHAPFTPAPRDATLSRTLARAARPAVQRAAARTRAVVAADRAADARADRQTRRRLPPARAVRAGDRRDDRRHPRAAAPARRRRTTPTSCSAPTTASTWASGGCTHGKQTYFDHDVRVPLIVVGPGVPARRLGQARGGERRPAADVPGARRRADRAARRGPQPGRPFLRGLPPRELARRDADRAPRAQPPAAATRTRSRRAGNPPTYARAALRRRALRRSTTNPAHPPEYYDLARDPRRAAQHLPVAVAGAPRRRWPRSSRGCARAAAAPPATRPTPGRRVSPHAGDPDRRAQRP